MPPPAPSSPLIFPPRSPILTRSHTNASGPRVLTNGKIVYLSLQHCLTTIAKVLEEPNFYGATTRHSELREAMTCEF